MGETLMHLVKLDRVRVEASVDPEKSLLGHARPSGHADRRASARPA